MKNRILLCLIAIIAPLLSFAQDIQFFPDEKSERLYSYDLINNGSYKPSTIYSDSLPVTKSEEFDALVANPSSPGFLVKSVEDKIFVGINHDTAVVESAYNYTISLKIWCVKYDDTGALPVEKDVTIVANYNPDSGTSYVDAGVFQFSDYHKIIAEVTNVYDNNLHATVARSSLPKNFYVMSTIRTERYDTHTFYIYPWSNAINNGSTLHITWTPSEGSYSCTNSASVYNIKPIEYDLEWAYIDDYTYNIYNNGMSGTPGYGFTSSSTINYDFRGNSTRVRVTENHYDLPIIYEHGAIVFRVRAVRPDPGLSGDYRGVIYSDWTLPDNGTANLAYQCQAYFINTAHDTDKLNWQYTINFAEDGKYKHVIKYYDGSLKERQTQTKINTDSAYVIAVDKVYDHEGRIGIQTLPIPILQPGVLYNPNLLYNAHTSNPYKADDFDYLGCSLPDSIPPFSSTSLANKYYSSLNTDKAGVQKFVPDAKGYPFIQSVYSPDNLLAWQGGAGIDHQLWKGHGTRYEYMRATQNEMIGLFGYEAGSYEYYPKQVITDANGQTSFLIQNKAGQTVASGLIGMTDTANLPISALPNATSGFQTCFDIIAGGEQYQADNTLSVTNPFYNENNGNNSLTYALTVPAFPVGIGHCANYLWTKAYYNFSATDECGAPVLAGTPGILGSDSVLATNVPNIMMSAPTPAWLAKGKYIASKQLSFSPDEIKGQVNNYVSAHEPDCFHDDNYFIRKTVEQASFPCIDSSAPVDECDAKRKQMIKDLTPGGKYAWYHKNPDGSYHDGDSSHYWHFLEGNPSAYSFDHYDYPTIFKAWGGTDCYRNYKYNDTNLHCVQTLSSISVHKNGKLYTHLDKLPIDTFIYIFNDTVAEALLPLHPEYCKLGFCNDYAYADEILKYTTANQAIIANRFWLDSIINHDPIYYNGAPSDTANIRIKLSHFKNDTSRRIDQYVIAQAYCSAGNSTEYSHAQKFIYSGYFPNFVFIDSSIKQSYFKSLIAAYIGNRSYLLQQQIDATSCSCEVNDTTHIYRCSDGTLKYSDVFFDHAQALWTADLWVLGDPIFPPLFNYSGGISDNVGVPDWMKDVFNDANDPNSDHSSLLTPPSQIQDSIDANNAAKTASNLDYIMDKLANCSETSSKLAQIRAGLLAYCNAHGLDSLTPQAVINVITDPTGANIPLNDLCNPFLLSYNVYDNSFDKEYTYDCGEPSSYAGVADLLSTSSVNTAIKNAVIGGSSVSSISLNSGNAYENKIASYLSVSSTATISVQSILDTIKYVDPSNSLNVKVYKYVHLKFFAGGTDTVSLYIKRKTENLAELDTVTGTINVDTAFCLNDDPDALVAGYVGKSTTVLDMTIDGSLKGRYYVWSSVINIMTDLSDGSLVKCISCISMKNALDAFKADKVTYGYDDAYNHPLFQSVLTNYLNYKLHKNHSYAEYYDLMNGCAVTDMTTLNYHWAPILVTLNTADTAVFLTNLGLYTERNIINKKIYYPSSSIVDFAIDLGIVPDDSLVYYVDKIRYYAGTGFHYMADRPLMVFDRLTCSPGTPLSAYMSPSTSSSAYVYINGLSYSYTLYQYSGTYSTPKQHADILAGVESYVHQCPGSFTMGDAALLRSDDYSTADKQAYLGYIYGLPVTSSYQIADSISPANLKARISSFTGTLSYDDPHCSNNKRDLYVFDPSQNSNGGYTTLTTILGGVKSTFGGNHLFPAAGNISTTGSTTGLMIYQKSDGVVWYRFFTTDNKLYNVHIAPPANPPFGINTLVYDSLQVGPGLDSIFNFTVFMHYSSVPSSVIACKGYTNFPLGYGRKVANVVLYNKPGNNICLDSVDCEYNQMQDAIASGRLMYQQYYDSVTTAVSDSMLAFLLRNVKDSLSLCTQYRKNQITRYYHDLAGNLEHTVPPSDYDNNPSVPQKASYYYYNSQNQLTKQKTPDGGVTEFFYDPVGKVVFSQNSKQRPGKNYSYTLYDKQERIIETGEVKLDCGSGVCNDVSNSEFTSMDTLVKFVQSHTRYDVVKTFYDTAVTALSGKTGYKLSDQENLLGRVSAIFYYRSKSADYNSTTVAEPQFGTYHSYDMMGNVKTVTYSCLALQPVRQQYKRVDYDYDQISGKVNMISYNRGFGDQFFCKYDYDADNRITEVRTSRDGIIWNRDAKYTYYKHGPLANLKIGDDQLQSIDYAYTIQGWLKAINGDVLRPDKDMGDNGAAGDHSYARDVMAMTLNYFNNDYKPIDNSVTVTNLPEPSKNLYNGNIAQQTLSVASIGSLQRTYQYDQVQRLKMATYGTVDENALTVASPSNIFKNSYDYDADGNIQSLVRYDNTGTLMDSLQYTYASASNKLQLVQDQVTGPTTPAFDIETPTYIPAGGINYRYDSIGNMVRDIYNNQKIVWDAYGKVRCIIDTVTNDVLFYDYDGAGNRIRKETVSKTTGEEETHRGEYYVNDASGNLLTTYKQNSKFSTFGLVSAANSGQQGNSEFIPFLLSHLNQFNFEERFRDTAITNEPGWWASYQSSRGLSFYLHNHDLFESFMESGVYISDLWSFDVVQPWPAPREGIFVKAMIAADYDDEPIFDEILNFSTEGQKLLDYLDTRMNTPDMMMMWGVLGITTPYDGSMTPTAHANNASALYGYITASPSNKVAAVSQIMDILHNDIVMNSASNAMFFYQDVMWDNSIFNSTNLRNPTNPPLTTFETAVADMMAAYSDDGSIDAFVGTWSGAGSWLNMNTTDAQRFDIAYEVDPAAMIQDFLTNASSGNDNLDHAIASVDRLNGLMYTWWIKSDTILGPNVSMDAFDGVAEDTLMLAEQHIYGSSKLAVQYFDDTASLLKDRVKNTYNADGTIVPMKDMEVQRPWYSRTYDDLIRYNQVDPWGNGNTDDISVYRRIGKKWFTMADHLGNVTALVQDRKSGHKANPTDLTYDYWLANLAEVSDYYPFGMKMPNRLTLSDNKHGYNGQRAEKDMYASVDPALGDYDVHLSAKFWEYDPRIGRRWNLDPNDNVWESPYAVFGGNPIWHNDVNGDTWGDYIMGAVMGLVTNIVPGTGGYRDSYTPTNSRDYNNGLRASDNAAMVTSSTMIATGTQTTEVGLVTTPAGGVGVPVAATGAVVTAAGVVMLANSANNASHGYNRGGQNQGSGKGRGKNNRQPDPNATGDHSVSNHKGSTTFKRNDKNPHGWDEVKRVDTKGSAHGGVETPHVHEDGKIRSATPDDIPKTDLSKNQKP